MISGLTNHPKQKEKIKVYSISMSSIIATMSLKTISTKLWNNPFSINTLISTNPRKRKKQKKQNKIRICINMPISSKELIAKIRPCSIHSKMMIIKFGLKNIAKRKGSHSPAPLASTKYPITTMKYPSHHLKTKIHKPVIQLDKCLVFN